MGKGTFFKYARALNKAWTQRKLTNQILTCFEDYQSLTDIGWGKYPTPAHSSHPVPPKKAEKEEPEKH